MKNLYLCMAMLLLMVSQSYGQQNSTSKDALHVKEFDQAGKLVSDKMLKGDEASIDLQKLIDNRPNEGRITVFGTYTTGDMKNHIYFDSKKQTGKLCKKEETKLKPLFGISGDSNESFTGFVINNVLEGSPASQLGLIAGDVIYYLGEDDITSFCDLHMAVNSKDVGEIVSVEYSKNGKVLSTEVTMAGKPYKSITFGECTNADILVIDNVVETEALGAELTVFPNPSRDITYLKYDSDSEEDVTFFVTDSNGAMIHQQHITGFNGTLRTDFSFDNQAGGLYFFVIQQGEITKQSKVLYIGQ